MLRQHADLVDAAYVLGGSNDEWLDRMLHGARRLFGVRMGNAYFYTVDRIAGRLTFGPTVLHEAPRSFFEESHAAMPREAIVHLFTGKARATSLSTEVPHLLETDPFIRQRFPKLGVADMIAFQTPVSSNQTDEGDHSDDGCMVTIYLPSIHRFRPRQLNALHTVARHLRLGLALRSGGERDDQSTKLLAATTTTEARAIWRGVLEGRWRLIAVDDVGGERRLVARPADPRSSRVLQPDERRVLELAARGVAGKEIAIELGVVESVVSKLLRRGMQKIGARTRAELVALLQLARG